MPIFDFSERENIFLHRLTSLYQCVCVDYAVEVGKFGSQYNGITSKWLKKNASAIQTRKFLKEVREGLKGESLETKYFFLREAYAIKPGVHEKFFATRHVQSAFPWIQNLYLERNSSQAAKATLVLKHLLAVENYFNLDPFIFMDESLAFPSEVRGAQAFAKYLMESTDWKAIADLRPLVSWLEYAPCAINEGPFVKRPRRLFDSLSDLSEVAVSYKVLEERVVPVLQELRESGVCTSSVADIKLT